MKSLIFTFYISISNQRYFKIDKIETAIIESKVAINGIDIIIKINSIRSFSFLLLIFL